MLRTLMEDARRGSIR